MEPHVSLLTLGVTDLEASITFYRDGLGLPMQDREPDSDVAFFPLDGTWLGLYPLAALAEDANAARPGDGFAGITLAHNVESETAVDAVLEEAVAAGGELVTPASETFWGGYSGYFADPDGYRWEVAYPPLEAE